MINSPRWLVLFALILAGEAIFTLPFHVARFFRPTMLEVMQLSNADLGDSFAVYGITAMLCYFPGGMIADKFSPRILLPLSLILTGLGGLFFASLPSGLSLKWLFGYWGITTILMFWAGMIKVTRLWGGQFAQGQAFGLLDAGRGLTAALLSSFIIGYLGAELEHGGDHQAVLVNIIYYYTSVTFIAGTLLFLVLPNNQTYKAINSEHVPVRDILGNTLTRPVWLNAGIIICAYCAYKGADNFGLFATQVLGMSQLESSQLTSYGAYLRPVGAIIAGLVADRISASKVTSLSFITLVVAFIATLFNLVNGALLSFAILNLMVGYFAIFALRGVYFALIEEQKIPKQHTGIVVGFVSVMGYTPDIFFAPLTGRILDSYDAELGFILYFVVMAAISFAGFLLSVALARNVKYYQSLQKQAY